MPDHSGEGLAALAFRGAVSDQRVVVEKLLPRGSVEIERAVVDTRQAAAVPRQQRVDQAVNGRQRGAIADLKPGHGDVARRVAVELDAGAGVALKGEFALHLRPASRADDAQATARDCDLL